MGKSIYFDTEFSEGFVKPVWWLPTWFPYNKPKWTIELISIGMVRDDGEEYYAINESFSRRNCNDWVKKNVLTILPERYIVATWLDYMDKPIIVQNELYKSLTQIKRDVIQFCEDEPVFYAYFADYDWVVVCSNIFGRMIDLPNGWPMYCKDLKQLLDENVAIFCANEIRSTSFSDALDRVKKWDKYPTNNDNHSAIGDAIFNKKLHAFINIHLKPMAPGRAVK